MAEDTQVDNQQQQEATSNVAAEQEARKFGWVPKEDYKGNESDWKDAETFLARGKEINGFLRRDLEKIKQAHEAELSEIRETMEQFRKYHNETEERAYKRALQDLKAEKAKAIEVGDGKKVVEIDEQMANLREAQVKPEPKKETKVDNTWNDWVDDNEWYEDNAEAMEIADRIGRKLARRNPTLKGRPFLDEITKLVKEQHPDLFENPNRGSTKVGSNSDSRKNSAGDKKKKSFSDLPVEAQQACNKFVKQGLMTQEQYLNEYDWE
jgi:hypothetical protein